MQTIEIDKGIRLHVIPTDQFKTVTLCLLFRRPLLRAESTMNTLIPRVMQRGCEKYPGIRAVNQEMERLYGAAFSADIVKKGEEQILQFLLEYTQIHGEEEQMLIAGLSFLKEMVMHPLTEGDGFKPDWVEGEKENLKHIIRGRINHKEEYAKLRCLEEMCKNEPFGIYADGYEADLPKINATKLFWQYKRILQESPIEWVVIGQVNEKSMAEAIQALFQMERRRLISIPAPEPGKAHKENRVKEENRQLTQGKICIGVRSGIAPTQKAFYPLMVYNELFGGSPNAKLFVNIREKESLCYSIGSMVYRFKGIMMIQCGADSEKLDEVLSLIKKEMAAMESGDFTEEEQKQAIQGLKKKFMVMADNPGAALDFYLSQYMIGSPCTLKQFTEQFDHVTRQDVLTVGKKLRIDTVYSLMKNVQSM